MKDLSLLFIVGFLVIWLAFTAAVFQQLATVQPNVIKILTNHR